MGHDNRHSGRKYPGGGIRVALAVLCMLLFIACAVLSWQVTQTAFAGEPTSSESNWTVESTSTTAWDSTGEEKPVTKVAPAEAVTLEHYLPGSNLIVTGPDEITDIENCVNPPPTYPDLECRNLTPGTARVDYSCAGYDTTTSATGGWNETVVPGTCWNDLDVCFYPGTPSEICIEWDGNNADSSDVITAYDTDTCPAGMQVKGACVHNYSGSSGIDLVTGDQMFGIWDGAGAYFEYPAAGDDYRLRYIYRDGGDTALRLMMPSGPLAGANAYNDFRGFIDKAEEPGSRLNGIVRATAEGCYPVSSIRFCQDRPLPPPPSPPVDGVCGAADGGTFASTPSSNFCSSGSATAVSGSGPWNWQCMGSNGGTNDSCSAAYSGGSTYTEYRCQAGSWIDSGPGSCGAASANNYFCFSGEANEDLSICCSSTPSDSTCSSGGDVTGLCGPADGGTYGAASDATNAGLCAAGTASLTPSGSGPWSWTCLGSGSGSDSPTCSADQGLSGTPECGPVVGDLVDGGGWGTCTVGTGGGAVGTACKETSPGPPIVCKSYYEWTCTEGSTTITCTDTVQPYGSSCIPGNTSSCVVAPPTECAPDTVSWGNAPYYGGPSKQIPCGSCTAELGTGAFGDKASASNLNTCIDGEAYATFECKDSGSWSLIATDQFTYPYRCENVPP